MWCKFGHVTPRETGPKETFVLQRVVSEPEQTSYKVTCQVFQSQATPLQGLLGVKHTHRIKVLR